MRGLTWHPLMYKLFFRRYAQRQWQEKVDHLLANDDAVTPLSLLDRGALADWPQVSASAASVGAPALVQDGLRLLDRITLLSQEFGLTRTREEARARDRLRREIRDASDTLLAVLDGLAVHVGLRARR